MLFAEKAKIAAAMEKVVFIVSRFPFQKGCRKRMRSKVGNYGTAFSLLKPVLVYVPSKTMLLILSVDVVETPPSYITRGDCY
jgi:hypothetical protein